MSLAQGVSQASLLLAGPAKLPAISLADVVSPCGKNRGLFHQQLELFHRKSVKNLIKKQSLWFVAQVLFAA